MSDGDCPARHTRLADLKRKPLRTMASRDDVTDDSGTDESCDNTSFESTKSTSPRGKQKNIYPNLGPGDVDDTDSPRKKDKNQSANKKGKSTSKSQPNVNQSPRATGEGERPILYPPLRPARVVQGPGAAGAPIAPEPAEDQPADGGGIFNILVVIGVIVVAVACYRLFYNPTPRVPGELSAADIFLQDFKELKNSFPSQDARFWKIIGAQVKRVLSNDSTYPAVILLGTPGGYEALGTCLAKRVISTLNNVVEMSGKMYIDTASLDKGSPAKTKFDLDQNLKSIFDESKGAIIDNVENLPAKAALLLHGYCDGDNAPYKDVVLFLMLHTDLKQDKLNDKVVEKSLTDLWGSELGVDEMPALCARIANNIVILTPEEDETLATCT